MRRPASCRSNGNQGRISWFPLWLPLEAAKKACRDRQASSVSAYFSSYRAGDGTRTHDVQLGKRHENNGCGALRAKNQRYTASLLQYALTNWRIFKPQR